MPFIPGMNRSRANVIVQESRSTNAAGASDNSSSPSKLPLPPSSTPTRALLRRIQRRSSTAAETVSRHGQNDISASHPSLFPPKVAPMTFSSAAVRRMPQASTPVQRRSISTARPSTLQRRTSNASMTSFTTASRHARTMSNATVRTVATYNTVKPSQDKLGTQHGAKLEDKPADLAPATTPEPQTLSVNVPAKKESRPTPASIKIPATTPVTPANVTERKHVAAMSSKKRFSMIERTALLRDAAGQQGQGLTHSAAAALEQEFAEQERILQGLQRDNERKTVEVEELRRQRVRFEEFCARHFGADDWYEMVFGVRQARASCEKGDGAALHSGSPSMTKLDEDKDRSSVSTSSQAIVENLIKTLQSPGSRHSTVTVEQSQTFLDDSVTSSPWKGSSLMNNSFESARADLQYDHPIKKSEEMVNVPRHLIQSLCDNQQFLLNALSAHI